MSIFFAKNWAFERTLIELHVVCLKAYAGPGSLKQTEQIQIRLLLKQRLKVFNSYSNNFRWYSNIYKFYGKMLTDM